MIALKLRAGRRAAARFGLIAFLGLNVSILAQDAPPSPLLADAGFNLGQILVTAPTKSERLADFTPGQVESITPEEMELRQAKDLNDLLKYTPGVEVENGVRRIGQEVNIRGLSGPRVLQTLDGGRLDFETGHKGSTFIDQDWLKSVEVIKGPASALYGSGALGGVLSMRTIKADDLLPADKVFGLRNKIAFSYADREIHESPTIFGRIRLGVDEQDPARLTYLFSFSHRTSDDAEMGGANGRLDNSGEEIFAGLATITYQPADHTKIRFSTATTHDDGAVTANTAASFSSTSNPKLDRRTLQSFYNLQISHRDPVHQWLNPQITLYHNRLDLEEIRTSPSRRVDDVKFQTFGFDLHNRQNLFSSGSHSLDLVYGVEYFQDSQRSNRSTVATGVDGFFPSADAYQISGYAQIELAMFSELITLIPGVRYDSYHHEATILVGGLPEDVARDENHLSPKVGGVLKLDDQIGLDARKGDYMALSANFAQGFRAPLFSELYPTGTHFGGPPGFSSTFLPNPDLKPETSTTWEAGPRVKIGDAHASFSYFETRARDFIGPDDPDVIPFFHNVNIDRVKITGVEFNAEYEFIKDWLISAGYSRIRGDNQQTGEPMFTIPADKVLSGLNYRNAESGFSAQLRVSHVFEQNRLPAGGDPSESYLLVDLFFSWSPRFSEPSLKWLEGFRLDLGVENLLDEAYTPYFAGVPESGINPRAAVTYTKTW